MLLLCALAPLLVLAGCGGGGGGGGSDVDAILTKAFGSKASVKSGRLTLAVDANVQGVKNLNGPVKLNLTGPFATAGDAALPRFDFSLGVTSGGQTFTAGAVSTSDKGWVRFQGQAYSLPPNLFKQFRDGYVQAQKQSATKDKQAPSLSKLGVDPRDWLTDPKKADDTTAGEVDAYHVTAGVDVPKLLDDVDRLLNRAGNVSGAKQSRLSPTQRKQIQDSVTGAKVDVFSGKDDGQLRKLVVDVKLKTGRLAVTLGLGDLNSDVSIKAPTGARPLSELTSALTQGGGGAAAPQGGTTGGTTGAAPLGATTAPTAPNSAYLQCTQKAGQDLAKFQACAKLLSNGG